MNEEDEIRAILGVKQPQIARAPGTYAELTDEEFAQLPQALQEHLQPKKPTSAIGKIGKIASQVPKGFIHGVAGLADIPEALVNIAGTGTEYDEEEAIKNILEGQAARPKAPPVRFGLGERLRGGVQELTGARVAEPYEEQNFESLGPLQNSAINLIGRSAGKGAEYLGASAGFGALPATAMGATAGALEHFGMPPGWSDLAVLTGTGAFALTQKGLQWYAKRNLINKLGEVDVNKVISAIDANKIKELPPGFVPTTAQLAENPKLALLWDKARESGQFNVAGREAAQEAAINRAAEGLYPIEGTIADTQQAIDSQINKLIEADIPHDAWAATKAGEKIRNTLTQETSALREARNANVGPEYDAIKKDYAKDRFRPENYYKYINENFKFAKGSERTLANKAKRMGKANKVEYAPLAESTEDLMQQLGHSDPNVVEAIAKVTANAKRKRLPPSWSELAELRKELNSGWRSARKRGDAERQGIYGRLISNLDKDLQAANPEAFARLEAANQEWRKYNEAIDLIEDNPNYKAFLTKTKESQEFTTPAAKIPDMLTKGEFNIEAAQKFAEDYPHVIVDPTFKAYINQETAQNIIDPKTGFVTQQRLNAFKKANPGFIEMYPELNTALRNPENANMWVNKTYQDFDIKKLQFAKGIAQDILQQNPKKAIDKVLASQNPTKDIGAIKAELMQADPSGLAWNGIQYEVADRIADVVKTGNPKKFKDFISKNKYVLPEIFDQNQMRVLEQIGNARALQESEKAALKIAVDDLHNPDYFDEAVTKLAESPMGMQHFWDAFIKQDPHAMKNVTKFGLYKAFKATVGNAKNRVIEEALTNPEYAALLAQTPKLKSYKSAQNALMNFVKESSKARYGALQNYHYRNMEEE